MLRQRRAHALERRVLIELEDDDRAAGEIDAELQAGPVQTLNAPARMMISDSAIACQRQRTKS